MARDTKKTSTHSFTQQTSGRGAELARGPKLSETPSSLKGSSTGGRWRQAPGPGPAQANHAQANQAFPAWKAISSCLVTSCFKTQLQCSSLQQGLGEGLPGAGLTPAMLHWRAPPGQGHICHRRCPGPTLAPGRGRHNCELRANKVCGEGRKDDEKRGPHWPPGATGQPGWNSLPRNTRGHACAKART